MDRRESGNGQSAIPDGTVLIDGMCVLCSWGFGFVARRDRDARFRFTAIQSPYGQWMAGVLGIDTEDPASFAVVLDGRALLKSDGALAILGALPWWSWCRLLRIVPRPLRDWVYDRVARNRFRLFGRLDACMLPDAALARHMIAGPPPSRVPG